MHLTPARPREPPAERGQAGQRLGSRPLWGLRPGQALARSREGVHVHAVVSRAGSGLSGGKSREIGDWDDCREEGSGVGEGGAT